MFFDSYLATQKKQYCLQLAAISGKYQQLTEQLLKQANDASNSNSSIQADLEQLTQAIQEKRTNMSRCMNSIKELSTSSYYFSTQYYQKPLTDLDSVLLKEVYGPETVPSKACFDATIKNLKADIDLAHNQLNWLSFTANSEIALQYITFGLAVGGILAGIGTPMFMFIAFEIALELFSPLVTLGIAVGGIMKLCGFFNCEFHSDLTDEEVDKAYDDGQSNQFNLASLV